VSDVSAATRTRGDSGKKRVFHAFFFVAGGCLIKLVSKTVPNLSTASGGGRLATDYNKFTRRCRVVAQSALTREAAVAILPTCLRLP